jgi:amidase
MTAIVSCSAIELARLIRARELSAREVMAAHLSRIEQVNPQLNAIITLEPERAMQRAQDADDRFARDGVAGPLHGLPIAHKDLQATAGIRTTLGSPIFRDYIPAQDSPLVARFREAGAIVIGKTNTPEFGAGSQTFNPIFGATLNPYDTTRTCGGSSGGAAVALSCGMLPIADGTDMGGSLRNPAAFCGVVGMRPSPGLLPWTDTSSGWASLSVDGAMARSAEDVAFVLRALAAAPRGAAGSAPPDLNRDFSGTRIAWWIDLGGVPFDPQVSSVVNAQRRVFQSLGCTVEEAEPDLRAADGIFRTLRAQALERKYGEIVRANRSLVKDTVLEEIARGEQLTPEMVSGAERARLALRDRVSRFMASHEFFILPTTQVPPFDVEQPYVREINGVPMSSYIDWMKSCYYVSAIGHPAISVPCGFTSDGLPVGLQIVGRDRDDWGVLQLAHAYERARQPFDRPHERTPAHADGDEGIRLPDRTRQS